MAAATEIGTGTLLTLGTLTPLASAGVVFVILVFVLLEREALRDRFIRLAGGSDPAIARRWLLADAAAPLAGLLIARELAVPAALLAMILAVFAGFFLYIGASELLPRTRDLRPLASNVAATSLGLALIYGVVRLAGG